MSAELMKHLGRCLVLLVAIQLVGCEHLRLYSDKRNQQGVDVKTAWSKVDMTALIAADRDNLNKILQSQLELQEKYATSIRDHQLRAMLTSDKTVGVALKNPIIAELEILVGTGNEKTIDAAVEQYLNQFSSPANIKLKLAQQRFVQAQVPAPTCKELVTKKSPNGDFELVKPESIKDLVDKLAASKNPTEERKLAVLNSALLNLIAGCAEPNAQSIPEALAKFKSGKLQDAVADMTADSNALATAKQAGVTLQKEYKDASEAYEKIAGKPAETATPAAASAATTASPTVAPTCKPVDTAKLKPTEVEAANAAARLCQAVADIEKADSAFGKKFLSQERLDSLQKLVDTINQTKPGDPVPSGASKATAAYVLIPSLIDEVHAAMAENKKPVAMSFLIQRNIEQLKLEAANREIALLETRAHLSSIVVEAIVNEIVLLYKAKTNLNKKPGLLNAPMATVFNNTTIDDKETLYAALVNYIDAISRQDVKWRKAQYQRLSTFHEVALTYAEVNLKQWTSLIDTAVQQVGDSAAGGIKPESYTNILNSLGIFYIGHGVSK
ncbi:hypothetical protein [Candidatus Nitrotoga sp. 1052]|uniref:hypothetical protein n=1 Tax=Candidatus Nitrotoga sp. 1052 TaxID=2886964 RepID=UPI001EF6C71D|nr:hypothetical protein [Candidatus Nitrotoga sp. 1052]CAH1081235.1 hypothetical protein NTG1052_390005 [Candidatus Nitrotoga sp. 1052]